MAARKVSLFLGGSFDAESVVVKSLYSHKLYNCCCLQVDPDPSALQALAGMGFQPESAAKALQQCRNNQSKAIERLVSWGEAARASTPSTSALRTDSEPSKSDKPAEPASLGGDSSKQLVSAASLLAQALQSNPTG